MVVLIESLVTDCITSIAIQFNTPQCHFKEMKACLHSLAVLAHTVLEDMNRLLLSQCVIIF